MLGARFENNGALFRVWAPNADQAFVAYDGHWNLATAFELSRHGEYFDGFVPHVAVETRYKFVFFENGQEIWRIDPAARDTLHSGLNDPNNGGLIVDTTFGWPPFETPRFEDLIIYQLHVGTFAGMNDEFAWSILHGAANISFIESKLDYIKNMGFNAIELLPIQEFRSERSWGYNPSFFYSVESAYGSPHQLRHFVAKAHEHGLAVLFDVVYNHISDDDSSLWSWDIYGKDAHGEYLYPSYRTDWGWGPAFEKQQVRNFFVENALSLFDEYRIDGLRFDATRAIEANSHPDNRGWKFLQELTWRIKEKFPSKYLIAEHLEDHDTIIRDAGMNATWFSTAHHEFQRACHGENPINKLKKIVAKDFGYGHNYPNQWNLVKYLIGSHDDCGDDRGGATLSKAGDWERHRYFVEFYGGRNNWYARAKARLGWALNVAAMGTPMMFMGLECHHWGYWHDTGDGNGDHRFNWQIAGDSHGMEMRRLVAATNSVRWANPCLRSDTLDIVHEDGTNNVLAFKRYVPGGSNCVLTVVNIGDSSFDNHAYGVSTGGQVGQWSQILCTQDSVFGGWDGAGNAFYEPWTKDNGTIYINLPKWSVVMMRHKG